jgi:hypothetical protein
LSQLLFPFGSSGFPCEFLVFLCGVSQSEPWIDDEIAVLITNVHEPGPENQPFASCRSFGAVSHSAACSLCKMGMQFRDRTLKIDAVNSLNRCNLEWPRARGLVRALRPED